MRRTNIFLFFLIPFVGVLMLFFLFSSLSRAFIQKKVKELVEEQLLATASILETSIVPLLERGYSAQEVLHLVAGKEDIHYLALLDRERNILGWRSRFEGYLPFSRQDASRNKPWIIDSPAGQIFNLLMPFSLESGENYYIYLGYSLGRLEEMLGRSDRNFLLLFAFLIAAGVLFFMGIFELQKNYLKKAREAEEERRDKERFREISAFTSAVAHEIKNPLNSLSLLCDLILRKGPPEAKETAVRAKVEVNRISEVVDRFSDAIKPLSLKKERFALKEIIVSAWNSVGSGSGKPAVTFRYQEKEPIILYGDKGLFYQGLTNLLRNAVEATDSGDVRVSAEKEKNSIIIRITDTGMGISPDKLSHIFDPFFSTKEKGLGIGLYLVRKIIEAHHGRIEVQSEPGQGTTFILQLPGGRHE